MALLQGLQSINRFNNQGRYSNLRRTLCPRGFRACDLPERIPLTVFFFVLCTGNTITFPLLFVFPTFVAVSAIPITPVLSVNFSSTLLASIGESNRYAMKHLLHIFPEKG